MPYYENPKAWEPNQTLTGGMTLTRLDSFFAVLAPEQKTEIQSYQDYQGLLTDRIAWMIQQWMEDSGMPMEEVAQMIRRRLERDGVAETISPSSYQGETPESWANALANSSRMKRIWTTEITPDYPIPMTQGEESRQDVIETVEEQTLEDWLLFFTKTG
jgi:hypothetical protein